MTEYVRVRDLGTGHVYSLIKSSYDADPEPYELLADEPATDVSGRPLPAVHAEPAETTTPPETAIKGRNRRS